MPWSLVIQSDRDHDHRSYWLPQAISEQLHLHVEEVVLCTGLATSRMLDRSKHVFDLVLPEEQ